MTSLYEGNESFGVRLYDPVGLILEFQFTSDSRGVRQ